MRGGCRGVHFGGRCSRGVGDARVVEGVRLGCPGRERCYFRYCSLPRR